MAEKADPDAILADIRRVALELGEPPTTDDYREHGAFSVRTVYNHFDKFVAARERAGVAEGELRPNSREELLEDIQRVAEVVGGEPSWDEYDEYGEYAIRGITYRFETWNDAKRAAGVYDEANHGGTKEMLIDDMKAVDAEIDGALSQVEYNERGEFSVKSVQREFGDWETGCQEAGVTRPDLGPRTEPDEHLLKDIRGLAHVLDRLPSKTEYNERGKFSRQMAINRFGSWRDAVRKAGFEPRDPGGIYGEMHPLWSEEPVYYGPNYDE